MAVEARNALEAHFSAWTKVGEREFLTKNFQGALKAFIKAHQIAKELNDSENAIKTLDMQASCKEQLGFVEDAFADAYKIIKMEPESPVGYLRLGKLLRLKRALEEAEKVYNMGLRKASKSSHLYSILEKQFAAVKDYLQKSKTPHEASTNGHILSMPINVILRLMGYMSQDSIQAFGVSCQKAFSIFKSTQRSGILGSIDIDSLRKQKYIIKLFENTDIIRCFPSNCTLACDDGHLMKTVFSSFCETVRKKRIIKNRIRNLCLGSLSNPTSSFFLESLRLGLGASLKCLRLLITDPEVLFKILNISELSELHLVGNCNCTTTTFKSSKSLSALVLNGSVGNAMFSNCLKLKVLIHPQEHDLNIYSSEHLDVVSLKYQLNAGMRPRPIRYLALNRSQEPPVPFLDLNQYSYVPIETLHLSDVCFSVNSLYSGSLIQSSCLSGLVTLRLHNVSFPNPSQDLRGILLKTPQLRALEISMVPLSNLNEFSTLENGAWLIDFIANQLTELEHLILMNLQLGPSAFNLLLKLLQKRGLPKLKVLGLVDVQSPGSNIQDAVGKVFRTSLARSHLLTNQIQYEEYCRIYNLFKQKAFYTIK